MSRLALLSAALAATVAFVAFTTASADELCSSPPSSYVTAKSRYPQFASALTELQRHAIATWYSDSDSDHGSTAYNSSRTAKARPRA